MPTWRLSGRRSSSSSKPNANATKGQQMSEAKAFWAIVELMGHQRMAGLLQETTIAGAGFLRVDVPSKDGGTQITRFVSPQSIYAINPVSEEIARETAAYIESDPVQPYDVPLLADKIRSRINNENAAINQGAPAPYDIDEDETL
jgi:hypothetical protein